MVSSVAVFLAEVSAVVAGESGDVAGTGVVGASGVGRSGVVGSLIWGLLGTVRSRGST